MYYGINKPTHDPRHYFLARIGLGLSDFRNHPYHRHRVVAGNLIVFEARVLGAGKTLDLTALARLALPLSVLGFLFAAMSGLTMFAT